MSLYVLDTDHVTLHQRRHLVLHRRMAAVGAQDLAVTIVTAEEQLRGWLRLIRRARSREHQVAAYQGLRIALGYYGGVRLLDFDNSAATRYEELRQQKIRIGTRDLRIGATVRLDAKWTFRLSTLKSKAQTRRVTNRLRNGSSRTRGVRYRSRTVHARTGGVRYRLRVIHALPGWRA